MLFRDLRVCSISYQAGGLYEGTSYCFGSGEKRVHFSCSAAFPNHQTAGTVTEDQEEGPSSAAQRGPSPQPEAPPENCLQAQLAQPSVPTSRFLSCSLVKPDSEKVKANIFFPTVKNTNIPSNKNHHFSTDYKDMLVSTQGKQASQHQRMATFYSCIF